MTDSQSSRQRLLEAAVEAFAERGFHATTTRDIAARAGMSPAALYVHHASKEQVLYEVSRLGHELTLGVVHDAVADATGPADQLAAFTRAFTLWHAQNRTRARIVQYELGSLAPAHFAEVAVIRKQIEQVVRDILAAGIADGTFGLREPDVPGVAIAILSLGIDVSRWYREGGERSAPEISELYATLAVRMAGGTGRTAG